MALMKCNKWKLRVSNHPILRLACSVGHAFMIQVWRQQNLDDSCSSVNNWLIICYIQSPPGDIHATFSFVINVFVGQGHLTHWCYFRCNPFVSSRKSLGGCWHQSDTRYTNRETWPLRSIIPRLSFHRKSSSHRWMLIHENSTKMPSLRLVTQKRRTSRAHLAHFTALFQGKVTISVRSGEDCYVLISLHGCYDGYIKIIRVIDSYEDP